MHAIPGRSAAWLVVDVRDLAALHAALLEPGRGPRRYTAGGHRVPVAELATMLGADRRHPNGRRSDSRHRAARRGRGTGQSGPFLPFDTPFTSAGMQYYTQMPASDDSPSERELGITYRDPRRNRGRHDSRPFARKSSRRTHDWPPSPRAMTASKPSRMHATRAPRSGTAAASTLMPISALWR